MTRPMTPQRQRSYLLLGLIVSACIAVTVLEHRAHPPHAPTAKSAYTLQGDTVVARLAQGITSTLPPLPDSVATMIGAVPVFRVANLECNHIQSFGCFSALNRAIAIRDSMSPVMSWKALLHEEGHLRLFDAFIRIQEPGLEDRIVDLWANYRLAAMIARPP